MNIGAIFCRPIPILLFVRLLCILVFKMKFSLHNCLRWGLLAMVALSAASLNAQDSTITLFGRIITEVPTVYSNVMVVNLRLGYGFAAKPDGSFEVEVKKADAIKIFCEGFETVTISLKDSIYRPIYFVNIELNLLRYIFEKAITIRPEPTLQELEEQKSKMDQHRYNAIVKPGVAGAFNPISMLYQMFSRAENDKRMYVELLNQQDYDNTMKNIIGFFVSGGLFDLSSEEEIERFIKFCNLSSAYVKKASMYEIGSSLNHCYAAFSKVERRRY